MSRLFGPARSCVRSAWLGAVLAAAATSCCALDENAPPRRGPSGASTPATFAPTPALAPVASIDLGIARYPAVSPAPPVSYVWNLIPEKPPDLHLGYALDPNEQRSVQNAHLSFAKNVSARTKGGLTQWEPPPGCAEDMRCVYETVLARSERDLAPLVALFRAHGERQRLSSGALAQLVISFVQDIPYVVPKDQPFGVLPPALVVSRRSGDCDSKVILAHGLLRALGLDTIVLSSNAHTHAMLGIALPTIGTKVRLMGRDYAFVEMTASGSLIGLVSPELLRPNDWRVVPVRGAAKAKPAGRPPAPSVPKGPVKL